ncbi:MAG: GNAT family N-acetyltransferase [Desulfitobacteriia bacterium]
MIIKKCSLEDLPSLQEISIKTYYDTFKGTCRAENMQAFLNKAYNLEKLKKELLNPNSIFKFLYADGELAGYLKTNEFPSQTDIQDPESLEVERLYLKKEFHNQGLGKELMEEAIKIAREKEKAYLWLGVWENNEKAKRFYKKQGFYLIGEHPFIVGDEEQTDLILRKDL